MIDWRKILDDKHYKTLERISMYPTPSNIPWPDIQDLLEKLKEIFGGRVYEEYGGRVCVKLDDGTRGVIHQADLAGLTAVGNVREIKGVIESTKIKEVIESGVVRQSR